MALRISFDRVAHAYDATRSLPPALAASVADLLARRLGEGRFLEFGVGTGRWARPLQARGVRVVGVDIAARMLATGRARGLTDAFRADAARLPFRDAAFDGTMSQHLLHLVPDWPSVLLEAVRVGTGRYRSVVELAEERPDLSDEYSRRLTALGWSHKAPGLPERELFRTLPPTEAVAAGEASYRVAVADQLRPLAERMFRYTWDVPEELHREVLDALATEHGGGTVEGHVRIVVAEWERGALEAFARASAARA